MSSCWILFSLYIIFICLVGNPSEIVDMALSHRSVVLTNLPEGYDCSKVRLLLSEIGSVECILEPKDSLTLFAVCSNSDVATTVVETLNHKTFMEKKVSISPFSLDKVDELYVLYQEYKAGAASPVSSFISHIHGGLSPTDKQAIIDALNGVKIKEESPKSSLVSTSSTLELSSVPSKEEPSKTSMVSGLATSTLPGVVSSMESGHSYHNVPKISLFSGGSHKSDCSFAQWKFEVQSLKSEHACTDSQLFQAIRKSLRGTASEVLMNMGHTVSVDQLVDKFERIFGNILPVESLLEQFYVARQREDEMVAAWSCRLEDLVKQIKDRDASISLEVGQNMLRTKFWSGLKTSSLKNAIRHKFDGGSTYEQLLVAARVAELETSSQAVKPSKVQQVTPDKSADIIKMLENLQLELNSEMKGIKQRLTQIESARAHGGASKESSKKHDNVPFTGKCHHCHKVGHKRPDCPVLLAKRKARQQGNE